MRIIAFFLLIVFIPILIIISTLLFVLDGKGVIFKQERIGLNKKTFVIYKFKTMKNNQVTIFGKILRKLGLDEIPQLVNIIKGEMNFVGPRPLTLFDIKRLAWNTEKQKNRWNIKPGITGISQLTNICNADLSLKNDLYYVDNQTFFGDIKIIFRTIMVPFLGKHTN